jgi:hypothetical protein
LDRVGFAALSFRVEPLADRGQQVEDVAGGPFVVLEIMSLVVEYLLNGVADFGR